MNIYDVALRYLANRSRTVFEMRNHLLSKDYDLEEINKLVQEYLDCGYLDDLRYCHEYMTYCYKKSKGKKRIITELRQKGVDPQVIDQGFDTYEYEIDEKELAYGEALKILKSLDLTGDSDIPEKVLARIGRRLVTLGYSSDLVYNVIGTLMKK